MRPFGLGWIAALVVAIAAPAFAAKSPVEAVSEQSRKAGMAKAPEIIAKAGLACTLSDARFIGASDSKKDGVKVNTAFFEVACTEGLGYIGNKDAYGEGGYEITISATTLAAEKVIMDGVRKLLQ